MIDEAAAIWLYGSCARGDHDDLSDVDVLHIGPANSPSKCLSFWRMSHKATISYYRWDQIARMAAYGSLFLHHLRLEGRLVAEGSRVRGRFRGILDDLPRYRRVRQDLDAYRQAVADVKESLKCGGATAFELSVLATTLRHAAVLGCYVIGAPDFGRQSAIEKYTSATGLNVWTHDRIKFLIDYKLWSEGRASAPAHAVLESSAGSVCDDVRAVITRVNEAARCNGLLSF
jgi:hypothetical protein